MSDLSIKVQKTIHLKPLMIPNFVLDAEVPVGQTATKSYELETLDQSAVDALAKDWLERFYAKAKAKNTWQTRGVR